MASQQDAKLIYMQSSFFFHYVLHNEIKTKTKEASVCRAAEFSMLSNGEQTFPDTGFLLKKSNATQ